MPVPRRAPSPRPGPPPASVARPPARAASGDDRASDRAAALEHFRAALGDDVFATALAAYAKSCAEQRWPAVLEWGECWIALGHTPEPAYRALMLAHAAYDFILLGQLRIAVG